MAEEQFIETIIGVGILLFAAKLMAELFLRIKLPIVLGELLAGMIVGPFALGAFFVVDGRQVLHINDEIKILGEIGAIVILFMAGLEMTPREFLKGGKIQRRVSPQVSREQSWARSSPKMVSVQVPPNPS